MAPRILDCAIWMKKTDSPSKRFSPETGKTIRRWRGDQLEI